MTRSKTRREANARELSLKLDSRTWYLLVENTNRPYPFTLEGKRQLALEILTRLDEQVVTI